MDLNNIKVTNLPFSVTISDLTDLLRSIPNATDLFKSIPISMSKFVHFLKIKFKKKDVAITNRL
jgi:hypothetical protein